MQEQFKISRRQWLQTSAGALLACGIWPGCARWAGKRSAGNFSFVVLNDAHFQSERCPAWFERMGASIQSHASRPEFCLMVGDLSEHGNRTELGAMRDVLRSFGMPFHAVIGNHDYVSASDRSAWDELFPRSLNYFFDYSGWQFIGLDSSEGTNYKDTHVQSATLNWLDDRLRRLDAARPTVVFTHFPLAAHMPMRPLNADDVLERFRDFNLVAVFNGHFHGFTENRLGRTVLTTNQCCAISRNNHNRTKEKGYFLCHARDGQIQREFVEVTPA